MRVGDAVTFRRSSGAVQIGEVDTVHPDGTVTVTFCEKRLYKTLSRDEVSSSLLFPPPLRAARARRSTGRKKKRRTGKKR